jgi:hypothetical protein
MRLQSTEYELSGIDLDDARVSFEREKKRRILIKCITKLVESIQPYVPEKAHPVNGLLPSGRSKHACSVCPSTLICSTYGLPYVRMALIGLFVNQVAQNRAGKHSRLW